jgi:RHS repeat-associated protein
MQDHLGSTSGTTDSSGTVSSTISYFSFGAIRSSTGTSPTDKKFTGQRLDNTGLYYYNARYYDPAIGRFISADTIVTNPANPQSLNRYSYCLNNPLKYTDPTGHAEEDLPDPYEDGQLGWSEGQWYIVTDGEWCPMVNNATNELIECYKDSTFTTWSEFMGYMGVSDIRPVPGKFSTQHKPENAYLSGEIYVQLVKLNSGYISILGIVDKQQVADRIRNEAAIFDSIGEGLTQSIPQEYMFGGLALFGIADVPAAVCVLLFYAGCAKGGDFLRDWADWVEDQWYD